jgi:hypothetical protein
VHSLGERGAGGGGRGAGRGVGRGADLHLATLDRRHVLRDAAGGAQADSGCTFRSSASVGTRCSSRPLLPALRNLSNESERGCLPCIPLPRANPPRPAPRLRRLAPSAPAGERRKSITGWVGGWKRWRTRVSECRCCCLRQSAEHQQSLFSRATARSRPTYCFLLNEESVRERKR